MALQLGERSPPASGIGDQLRALARNLFESDDDTFLQRKLDDHRALTVVSIIIFGLAGITMWPLDYLIDPMWAKDTLTMRLAFLWLMVPAALIQRTSSYKHLAVVIVICAVAAEVQIVQALNKGSDGMGGILPLFLYFPFVALVVCIGFSALVSAVVIAIFTFTPILMAVVGYFQDFRYMRYCALMLPAAFITLLISGAFALEYRRRYALQRQLEVASVTDPMTGVANRRQFQAVVRQEIIRCQRQQRPCTLMMLDIDHFKMINDTYGHPAGDRVICQLADMCREMSRETDMVARLGGEEFAILVADADLKSGAMLAERIRSAVSHRPTIDDNGEAISWTVSIGVASIVPELARNVDEVQTALVKEADAALYRAKSGGRNRVISA